MYRNCILCLGIAMALLLIPMSVLAAPVKVEVVGKDGSYQLHVDGKPFFIRGAGGMDHLKLLADIGGNSIRTWGADDLGAKLDEAKSHGIMVTVGIWLGHERHGFNYNDLTQVAEQYERARQTVLRYRDHPAVLMWSIGNEMEGFADGGNAAIWSAVNNIATMVKQLDPNRPTMTVVAEVGGKRIEAIHRLCPAIDIVGINTYAGAPSIPQRYRAAGGTKPYILTEFGPPGTWEVEKNSWGAVVEPTSTRKTDFYRRAYEEGILAEQGKLCLGSYVFKWGSKQEATATWFGMLLPDGTKTSVVDTMQELWSGKAPANRAPSIKPIEIGREPSMKPGTTFTARVEASDPESDTLRYEWVLQQEAASYNLGGDAEAAPPTFPDAIVSTNGNQAELRMPEGGGGYRLFVVVRDGKGSAATANIPLFVEGAVRQPVAGATKLPFVLYADDVERHPYIWSGWMGNTQAIGVDEKCTIQPRTGQFCMKLEYRASDGFGGVVWVNPPDDWGDRPGGFNLTGAQKLTFWARGEQGGERVEFKFGVIGKEKPFHDTDSGGTVVTLTKEWKQYEIPLAGKDLTNVKTGFVWVVGGQGRPVTFYVDDVRYE